MCGLTLRSSDRVVVRSTAPPRCARPLRLTHWHMKATNIQSLPFLFDRLLLLRLNLHLTWLLWAPDARLLFPRTDAITTATGATRQITWIWWRLADSSCSCLVSSQFPLIVETLLVFSTLLLISAELYRGSASLAVMRLTQHDHLWNSSTPPVWRETVFSAQRDSAHTRLLISPLSLSCPLSSTQSSSFVLLCEILASATLNSIIQDAYLFDAAHSN